MYFLNRLYVFRNEKHFAGFDCLNIYIVQSICFPEIGICVNIFSRLSKLLLLQDNILEVHFVSTCIPLFYYIFKSCYVYHNSRT